MSTAKAMMETYPGEINLDRTRLAAANDALTACSASCTACADACLSEPMVAELVKCVRTDLDGADVCEAAARVLSRHTGYDANISRALLEACAVACKECADECERHASMHEHCRLCAETCRECERVCRDLQLAMA
ncbi:four-helix bundle copper-binding protein [Glycomyces sp. NPDC049804]|uniref:four-helix bundle copper-binding protein n=1 Tax=Glycomyces sp. NPDC049804 TaxID=3154363 RepID=UPI003440AEB6